MHANPTRPYLGWTALSLIATASVLSSGCARFYHLMHYNCFARSVEDQHLSYYHSPKTGRIIPKEHHQVCQVEFPCFGYEPTCWHRWPAECGSCPVQDSVGYGVDSCQAPCAPCAQSGAVMQDTLVNEFPQGMPVQETLPTDANEVPLDQVSPLETEPAAPAIPVESDSAYQDEVLPEFADGSALRQESPLPQDVDWMTMRSTRTVEVETLLIPEIARAELQRTPSFLREQQLSLTTPPDNLPGRLPQLATVPAPAQEPTTTEEIVIDDATIRQSQASPVNSVEPSAARPAAQQSSVKVDAEVTRDNEIEMDELTAQPANDTPAFELIETTQAQPVQVDPLASTQQEVVEPVEVPTFRIKPTLPPTIARQPVASALPPVKMAAVEVKDDKPGVIVRFVSERSSEGQQVVAEKKVVPTDGEPSLKFR